MLMGAKPNAVSACRGCRPDLPAAQPRACGFSDRVSSGDCL